MYLMYIDESGDIGLNNSPTRYFILTGLVIHEQRWRTTLHSVITLRQQLKQNYGLKLREEIHAAHLIQKPGNLSRINKSLRLRILRDVVQHMATLPDIDLFNVVVDKQGKPQGYDVFENAWTALIQRFENTIQHKNFRNSRLNTVDNGILVPDDTDVTKLKNLVRKMRYYNPIPSQTGNGYRNLNLNFVIEDPVHRKSDHSYFIQLCDVSSYLLKQNLEPCQYVKKKGGKNYFTLLNPILNQHVCNNRNNPTLGTVYL